MTGNVLEKNSIAILGAAEYHPLGLGVSTLLAKTLQATVQIVSSPLATSQFERLHLVICDARDRFHDEKTWHAMQALVLDKFSSQPVEHVTGDAHTFVFDVGSEASALAKRAPFAGRFEVSLTRVRSEDMRFSPQFFSVHDLQRPLAQVARRVGFKLMPTGLYLPLRDNLGYFADVLITNNWDAALNLLGHDPRALRAGAFPDRGSMLRYALSSPYVTPDVLARDSGAHGFQAAAQPSSCKQSTAWLPNLHHFKDEQMSRLERSAVRRAALSRALAAHPDFARRRDMAYRERTNDLGARALINRALTQLSPRRAAKLNQQMRSRYPNTASFNEFVLNAFPGELEDLVKDCQEGRGAGSNKSIRRATAGLS